jgi:hypothetical protein
MTVLDAPALIAVVKLGEWQRTDPNTGTKSSASSMTTSPGYASMIG